MPITTEKHSINGSQKAASGTKKENRVNGTKKVNGIKKEKKKDKIKIDIDIDSESIKEVKVNTSIEIRDEDEKGANGERSEESKDGKQLEETNNDEKDEKQKIVDENQENLKLKEKEIAMEDESEVALEKQKKQPKNRIAYKPIPRCRASELTPERFREQFVPTGLPVVIEGGQTWGASNWTLEYLQRKIGHHTVDVRLHTSTAEYRVGRKYLLKTCTVHDYLEDLIHDKPQSMEVYMAVQHVTRNFPELAEEVASLPAHIDKLHSGPFLWVGHAGHYEFTHYDPEEGMLCMIWGSKRVRLFSNKFLPNLYPNILGSKGRTIQSTVDLESPDYGEFPLFAECEALETVLNPGDMLYIPFCCWHQVSSLTKSVSINIFWGDAGSSRFLSRILFDEPTRNRRAMLYWLENIIRQNVEANAMQPLLYRFDEVLHQFLYRQFKEDASKEVLDELVRCVCEWLKLDGLPECPPHLAKDKKKFPPPLKIRGLKIRA